MGDRLAADIRIDVCDLTQPDLDELTTLLEDAVAGYQGTVTVDTRTYLAAGATPGPDNGGAA